jgi:hypothetical protein
MDLKSKTDGLDGMLKLLIVIYLYKLSEIHFTMDA